MESHNLNTVVGTAEEIHAAGICVLPAKTDGTKRPLGNWRHWQTNRPTTDQVQGWFAAGHPGLGVVTGNVSNGLEMIELEGPAVEAGLPERIDQAMHTAGLGDLWATVTTGYGERSPSGGIHIFWRSPGAVEGNLKLARRPGPHGPEVLIETRGEGGWCVVAPSNGTTHPTGRPWVRLTGAWDNIPTVTPDQRASMLTVLRTFDEMPPTGHDTPDPKGGPDPTPTPTSPNGTGQARHNGHTGPDTRPGDEYNDAHTCDHVLTGAGFTWHSHDTQGTHYTRPGKDPRHGSSATVWADTGRCTVFSSSVDVGGLNPDQMDPWRLHVALNYRGDFAQAASEWRRDHPRPGRPAYNWATEQPGPPPIHDTPAMPEGVNDAQMGEAFGHHIDGRYLFCGPLGGWLRWDGTRWKLDGTEAVYDTAREWVLDVVQQLAKEGADSDTVKRAAAYRSRSAGDNVVTVARRLRSIAATPNEFDQHPDLLTVRNGIINLRTGELGPHDPALKLTKLTDIDYSPDARHPDVDAALQAIDDDTRDWLQVVLGYSATGHVSEDLMVVLDGTGSNGKTTLLESVKAALGEHASTAPTKLLMRGGNDEHPTLLADLAGRRLVTIEETAEGGALATERMKMLTGGSDIKARHMRQDYFTFTPSHQILVATNHRPAVATTEHATWRRLRLVPFPHRYETPEKARHGDRPVDKGLRERLKLPSRAAAMLAWIVTGAVRWHRDGLHDSATVTEATNEWRQSEDAIYRFATERLEFSPEIWVASSELHAEYRRWCEAEGRPVSSQKEFSKRFRDHDYIAQHHVELKKTNGPRIWRGVKVADAL